jgi:hypothetical protein
MKNLGFQAAQRILNAALNGSADPLLTMQASTGLRSVFSLTAAAWQTCACVQCAGKPADALSP